MTARLPKPLFSVRHPHIYRVYRGGRKVIIITKPFLEFAALVAQIKYGIGGR